MVNRSEIVKQAVTHAVLQGMLWPMTHDQFNVVLSIIEALNRLGLINYGEAVAALNSMMGGRDETKNVGRDTRHSRS